MNSTTAILSIALLVLATLTFRIWFQPPKMFITREGHPSSAYAFVAAALAIAFFVACFSLGVWFSILRIRGEIWSA